LPNDSKPYAARMRAAALQPATEIKVLSVKGIARVMTLRQQRASAP
jgi:hypothetical protein